MEHNEVPSSCSYFFSEVDKKFSAKSAMICISTSSPTLLVVYCIKMRYNDNEQ